MIVGAPLDGFQASRLSIECQCVEGVLMTVRVFEGRCEGVD